MQTERNKNVNKCADMCGRIRDTSSLFLLFSSICHSGKGNRVLKVNRHGKSAIFSVFLLILQ